MIKGFRDFIMRGNVIDLAIAVVVGAAFSGIVTQFTKSFIEPIIKDVDILDLEPKRCNKFFVLPQLEVAGLQLFIN